MKKPYLFFFFFLLCLSAFAQKKFTVSATVDKATILIGEPFQLTLEATFSKAHAPLFFALDTFPHFEMLTLSGIDTQETAGQTILKQTVSLTSWDSGAWAIPALSLPGLKGAATKPVVVNVTFTPMPAAQDYHDIKDIIEVERPPRTTWYWYVAGGALLLLLVLLLFPKKKKQQTEEKVAVRESAYETALKALDSLKTKNDLDDTAYFTELILVFRTYLQQRHGIHSFQQTTGELSRQLQRLTLPHGDLKKLVHTLELSDFVKFAQYKATAGERDEALDDIRKNIVTIEQLQK